MVLQNNIKKCLDIPVSKPRSIIRKWKLHHTTQTLPRKGRLLKVRPQTTRLVREATERPRITGGATEFSG